MDDLEKPIEEQVSAANFELDQTIQKLEIDQQPKFESTFRKLTEFKTSLQSAFSQEDYCEVLKALSFMIELHIDHKPRVDGSPYVAHPLKVADNALRLMKKPDRDTIIAALTHDAIEDETVKLVSMNSEGEGTDQEKARQTLSQKFGDEAANYAFMLTNPDFDSILKKNGVATKTANYENLSNKLYAEHVKEIIKLFPVLVIKLSDFIDNGLRVYDIIEDTDYKKRRKGKLAKKYLPIVDVFLNRLSDPSLEDKINGLDEIRTKFLEAKEKLGLIIQERS